MLLVAPRLQRRSIGLTPRPARWGPLSRGGGLLRHRDKTSPPHADAPRGFPRRPHRLPFPSPTRASFLLYICATPPLHSHSLTFTFLTHTLTPASPFSSARLTTTYAMDAISCLMAPPPALLPPGSFADAAIARALHFSTMSADSASSSSSASPMLADLAAYAPAPAPRLVAVDSPPPPPRRSSPASAGRGRSQQQLGARAAGKRRSRASKRAPTTYISTDAANFRLMVQHITGAQDLDPPSSTPPPFDAAAASMLLAAAAAAGGADSAVPAGAFGNPLLLPADELHHHHHQPPQPPCFPTLDSWNVMYESTELL
ncbi:hypothetical protein ACP4OV_007405 [Aristida adscensionis]